MCGIVEEVKDIGRDIDDGLHSAGSNLEDAVRKGGKVFDDGMHAAVGTMAGMAFPVISQKLADKFGYENSWFNKGLDLGTGIDMAAAAYFGGSQLFGGMQGLSGAGGSGGLGGMVGSGASPAGGTAASGGNWLSNIFGGKGGAGGAMDLLRGGFGLYQAQQLRKASKPSAINRQAEAELAALMADPSRVTQLPGYEAGIEAVQRGMAAGGYLGSGNMAAALQKYGGDFYTNAVNQYSNLSQLGRQNEAQYNMGSIQLAGQAMNSLGYGALKLFGK